MTRNAKSEPAPAPLREAETAALVQKNRWVLLRGTVAGFITIIAGIATTLGLQMVLSRLMGAAAYGEYAYVISWIEILATLATLGLDVALLRYLPAYTVQGNLAPMAGILARSRQVVLLSGLVLGVVLAGTIRGLSGRLEPSLYHTFLIAVLLLPLTGLLLLNHAALRAFKCIVRAQIPKMLFYPVLLAALAGSVAALLPGDLSAPMVMSLELIAVGTALLLSLFLLRPVLPTALRSIRPIFALGEWLRVSLPMLVVSEMALILKRTDIILVGALLGTTQAGIYVIATKMSQVLAFGLKSVNLIAGPMISELYTREDHPGLQKSVTLAAWLATFWCMGIGLVLIWGRFFFLGLFGAEFKAGAMVFIILTLGQMINAWTGPVDFLLSMTGHHNTNARIFTFVVLGNTGLNLFAIHLWGMTGAACATSLSIALKNIWTWFEVKKRLRINGAIFNRFWKTARRSH